MAGSLSLSIEPILETLKELLEEHRALRELGSAKRDALVAGNVDELNRIVGQESKRFKSVERLEEQRLRQTVEVYQSSGFRLVKMVTVSDLVKLVYDADQKERLTRLHGELTAEIKELKRLNELNMQLAQQALQFIEFSYDLYLGPDEEMVYKHPAMLQQGKPSRGLFDTKA